MQSEVYKMEMLMMRSANLECGDGSVAHMHIAFNKHVGNAVVLKRATNHV